MNLKILKKYCIDVKKEFNQINSENNSILTNKQKNIYFKLLITINYLVINNLLSDEYKNEFISLFSNRKKSSFILLVNKIKNEFLFMFDIFPEEETIKLLEQTLSKNTCLYKLLFETKINYWEKIEIIGWLYQFFIIYEKDSIIKSKKTILNDEIGYATQFFTPDWIVKYMVENTIIKNLIENEIIDINEINEYPYLIKENLYFNNNSFINIEKYKIIDPAMGTAHILVYIFEVLYEIYFKLGYEKENIPYLILNNIYGLDIDEDVYELAIFSLYIKCYLLNNKIDKKLLFNNFVCFKKIKNEIINNNDNNNKNNKEINNIIKDIHIFGSLTNFTEKQINIIKSNNYYSSNHLEKYINIIQNKFDYLITNPPYMGKRYMNKPLYNYLKNNYKLANKDLFSCFIEKGFDLVKSEGLLAFMTPFVWLYIITYKKLREKIINEKYINSLIQLEYSGFSDATVPICTFVLKNKTENKDGMYITLETFKGSTNQEDNAIKAINNKNCNYKHKKNQYEFNNIPNKPIAYWVEKDFINIFRYNKLEEYATAKQGMATTENKKFLRFWYEVDKENINFDEDTINDKHKYYPYNKGGDFRKWYGNHLHIIDYYNNGEEIKKSVLKKYPYLKNHKYVVKNESFFLKEGITWSFVSSAKFGIRYIPKGFIFDVAGSTLFCDKYLLFYLLGFLSTNICFEILKILNPTLNFQVGDINQIPIKITDKNKIELISNIVKENIELCKSDWDEKEISWNHMQHPAIKIIKESKINDLSLVYGIYKKDKTSQFNKLKHNEIYLNNIFCDIYGLNNSNINIVNDKDISIEIKTEKEFIESLISFFVGIIFNRYDINLNLKYSNFITITENSTDENDIIIKIKEILTELLGKEHLNNNFKYIVNNLRNNNTRNETLEFKLYKYFQNNFTKRHLIHYKKTPIYWVFNSGKNKIFSFMLYYHNFDLKVFKEIINKVNDTYKKIINDKHKKELLIFKSKLENLIISNFSISKEKGINYNFDIISKKLK